MAGYTRPSESWGRRLWRALDSWLFGSKEAPQTKTRGQEAEGLAARYLQTKGYEIVARNWRCRWGELDLVCIHNDAVVAVEVKSARADEAYRAATRVTRRKRQRLLKLLEIFVKQRQWTNRARRIDIVEITFPADQLPTIRHFENAVQDRRFHG